MIDVHCHIINGVDDGSMNINESVRMLKMAYADGIDTVVLTSHIKPPSYMNKKSKLFQKLMELKMECYKEKIPIKLILGAENHLNFTTFKNYEDIFISYGDQHKYMLIEFPYYPNMYDHPTRFLIKIKQAGYIPVIAHPERYAFVWSDYSLLKSWKNMGCLLQVNRTSVLHLDTDKAYETSIKMLDDNLVDIIASDAHHSTGNRIPVLSDVYAFISENYGEERAKLLFEINPSKIIK